MPDNIFPESLKQPNAGKLFYRDYFAPKKTPSSINELILKTDGANVPAYGNNHSDSIITIYPGLLIGSGYGHDYKHPDEKMKESAFKIGYYFEHTSSMPVIPGSSVKGMLRSAFPQRVLPKRLEKEFHESRENLIRELLETKLQIDCDINIDKLEKEIFDGLVKKDKKDKKDKPIPVYERDIFFDAVPVEIPVNNYEESEKRLFGDDNIAPHKNKEGKTVLDPFSNPQPIKFLKVMPGVKYEFRFRLFNSRLCAALTAEKKKDLFHHILLTLGIGAKTNVGYGQFRETEDESVKNEPENKK